MLSHPRACGIASPICVKVKPSHAPLCGIALCLAAEAFRTTRPRDRAGRRRRSWSLSTRVHTAGHDTVPRLGRRVLSDLVDVDRPWSDAAAVAFVSDGVQADQESRPPAAPPSPLRRAAKCRACTFPARGRLSRHRLCTCVPDLGAKSYLSSSPSHHVSIDPTAARSALTVRLAVR
jgi:hypothetical protein